LGEELEQSAWIKLLDKVLGPSDWIKCFDKVLGSSAWKNVDKMFE